MTTTAHIIIDSQAVSPAKAIAAAARGPSLLILTGRAFTELCDELGGLDHAMRHLLRVATNAGRPIGVNAETGAGTSGTALIAPRSWSAERLQGWVAGYHVEIEAMFGKATIREDV